MEILGVGPMELIFILIIALIVLGPEDMAKAGRTVGRTLRKIVMSPTWHAVQQTTRELRTLPHRLMREAGLDDLEQEINVVKNTTQELRNDINQLQASNPRRPRAAPARPDRDQNMIHAGYGAWSQKPRTPKPQPDIPAEPSTPEEPPADSE